MTIPDKKILRAKLDAEFEWRSQPHSPTYAVWLRNVNQQGEWIEHPYHWRREEDAQRYAEFIMSRALTEGIETLVQFSTQPLMEPILPLPWLAEVQ